MKIITKLFAIAFATAISTSTLFANTTGVKATVNHLVTIEEEVEQSVEDVFFTTEETIRYTRLEVAGVEPDSAEIVELASDDIHFNTEEIELYQKHKFRALLSDLTPVGEEEEPGVNDISFSLDEKKPHAL